MSNSAPESAPEAAPSSTSFFVEASDGTKFAVTEAACNQSVTIKDLILTIGSNTALPFNNIDGPTMKLIVEWCEHHKDEEIWAYDYDAPIGMSLPAWDLEFLEKMKDEDFEKFLRAANYLSIKKLVTYGCKKIQLMIKDKNPEQLREQFMIATDEEEEALEKKLREESEKREEEENQTTKEPGTSK
ncbi:hypothetical protein L5515_003545 [Caenorhabditis briggsae]|uniref:Skp1-related protein n=1 Tax=Caenorhabditis briggsae TaxID=6238 RepID=A0AAE9EKY1_CAEBR|nr:hypothetical protein L5515_003545 [Caenorhabditis briggsae]